MIKFLLYFFGLITLVEIPRALKIAKEMRLRELNKKEAENLCNKVVIQKGITKEAEDK